jgi:hypothetical protein
VAVEGAKMDVVFSCSGSETFSGPGNTDASRRFRISDFVKKLPVPISLFDTARCRTFLLQ